MNDYIVRKNGNTIYARCRRADKDPCAGSNGVLWALSDYLQKRGKYCRGADVKHSGGFASVPLECVHDLMERD